jgi:hypothetical protein
MTWYVGLTNDPDGRRQQHGNPSDWHQTEPFPTEKAARDWEAQYVGRPGYQGGPGGAGWRYGYWFTITPPTRK